MNQTSSGLATLIRIPIITLLSVTAPWMATPAFSDDEVPVRLWAGGQEIRTQVHPLHSDEGTLIPVEALSAFSLRVEPSRKKNSLTVIRLAPGVEPVERRETLPLLRRGSAQMVPLQELARFLDAEVELPHRGRPLKPGDPVYVLARLKQVRIETGALRIDTSFPVPYRAGSIEPQTPGAGAETADYVECVGAIVPPGFVSTPVPPTEVRLRALVAQQFAPHVVRVVVKINQAQETGSGTTPNEPLALGSLLRQVQSYYPKLLSADAQRRVAQAKREEKAGAFDPVLFGGSEYSRYPDSTLPGKLKSFSASDVGVEFLTPYGIKVIGLGRWNRGDVKSPLSLTGNRGEYSIGLKVPLLRGRGINDKFAALRQARLGVPLADAEFDDLRLTTLLDASTSYWGWVAAGRRLEVAESLLELARTRAGQVKARADAGDLPQIDVVEADTEVQRRLEGLGKALRDFQKEGFKLALYLWTPDGKPTGVPLRSQLPADTAPAGELTPERVEDGRALALSRRPELRALSIAQQIAEVDLGLARNQRLPIADLSVFPGVDTGSRGAGGTLKASIDVALPLRQRTADGLVEQARLKLDKLSLDLQLERQRVLTEVDDAVSAVNLAVSRYQAAIAEVELARQLEQGERDRFALGDSTLFLVNQRERATAEAATKVINLRAEYEQALAYYQAATAQY